MRNLNTIFILFLLVMTFRLLANLPMEAVNKYMSFLYISFLCLFYVLYWVLIIKRQKILHIDLIVMATILYIFVTAYQAKSVFGQPLVYGLLTQGATFLIFSGLFIYNLLINGSITVRVVERALFIIGFAMVIIILSFYLFADPKYFVDYEFAKMNEIRGVVYKFSFISVVFLFLYSMIRILRKEYNWLHLIALLLSFTYFFAFQQKRSVLIALFITLLIFYAKNFSFAKNIMYFLYFTIGILGLLVVGLLIKPESVSTVFTLFGNLLAAEDSSEAGISVRFIEVKTALEYIWKNPFFGNGLLHSAWNEGFKGGVLGHFSPSDIGIIGNLFVYGIVGVVVLYLPIIYAFILSRKIGRHDNVLLHTCQYVLVFLFFLYFMRASNLRSVSEFYFYVFMIYYYYRSQDYLSVKEDTGVLLDQQEPRAR